MSRSETNQLRGGLKDLLLDMVLTYEIKLAVLQNENTDAKITNQIDL